MIIYYAILLGAVLGAYTAVRKKGNFFDIVQYIMVYGLVFGMAALFVIIFAARNA